MNEFFHKTTTTIQTGARIVAIISVVVILLSIVIFCLETLPEFKHYTIYNMTSNITRIVEDEVPTLSEPFFLIETTCIVSNHRAMLNRGRRLRLGQTGAASTTDLTQLGGPTRWFNSAKQSNANTQPSARIDLVLAGAHC